MKKATSLNIFFGNEPSDSFFNDLFIIEKLSDEEVFEIIDLIIEWFPKEGDIDTEWKNWTNGMTEELVALKKSLFKVLLFIFKEYSSQKVTEIELKEDFAKIGISENVINYLVKKLNEDKSFKNKALDANRPYENYLIDINWRIDKRYYNDNTIENKAVVEFIYYCKNQKTSEVYELGLKSLDRVISILNQIKEQLCSK